MRRPSNPGILYVARLGERGRGCFAHMLPGPFRTGFRVNRKFCVLEVQERVFVA